MIPSISLHIGRVVGVSCYWRPKSENKIYFVHTPSLPLRFFVTPEIIKNGDFVLYGVLSSSYKALLCKQLKDLDIIKMDEEYSYIEEDQISYNDCFCTVIHLDKKNDVEQKYGCSLFFKNDDRTIDVEEQHYQVSNISFTREETELLVYFNLKNELNPSIDIFSSFCHSVSIDSVYEKKNNLINYVDTLDVNKIIDSYVIKEGHIYIKKIGGDDRYEEFIKSEFTTDDLYLRKLLPYYYNTYWEDKGYGIEYPPKKLSEEYRQLAKKISKEYQLKAKSNYNKIEHIDYLLEKWLNQTIFEKLHLDDLCFFIYLETRVVSYWGHIPDMGYVSSKLCNYGVKLPASIRDYNEEEAENFCKKWQDNSKSC